MERIEIDNTDENADWIKWRIDDVQISKAAKQLLQDDKEETGSVE